MAAVLVYLGLEHLKLQSRRFKKTLLARLKQSLKKPACRTTLKRLCEMDDLSMYRDLKGKDLQDKVKIQALADLGLVHYNVLLADQVTGKCFVNCTTAQIFEQWDYYQKAANAKDAEGCGELASVLGAIADHKRVEAYRGHTIKQLRQKSWDLYVEADLHGREYIHAGVAIFFDEQGIPYGRTTISKHLMATLNYITKTYVDKGDIRNATHLINKPVGVARATVSQAETHAAANKMATSKIMARGGRIKTSVV